MSSLPSVLQGKATHDTLQPIIWIMGKWLATDGKGSFPTMSPFSYGEQIEFCSTGQPLLNYSSFSWHPEKKIAMHSESGYLRIKPGGNQLSFMVAHNFGLTTLEEGEVTGKIITLSSKEISRMSWAAGSEVTKIERSWSLKPDGTLEQVVRMETKSTPLSEHLRVSYTKID